MRTQIRHVAGNPCPAASGHRDAAVPDESTSFLQETAIRMVTTQPVATTSTAPTGAGASATRPRRVLHINKFLYRRGGAEGYMEDLAALQEGQGQRVTYFGMAHAENTHTEYARHFPSEIELEPIPDSLRGKVRGAGRILWSTSARRGLDAVLADFQPDVVHLHNVYHQLSPSILQTLARRRIPAVMTLHDYKLACPSYQFLDKGEICEACIGGRFHQAARRRCQGSLAASALLGFESFLHSRFGAYGPVGRFICPSRFMAEKMTQAGVYPDRLRWVPHFVDPSTVRTAERPGRDVVFAGRLSAEKGVDTLIDAMSRLDAPARLTVAGDGPERAALEAQAERVAPGRVRFLGRLGREELHDLVRSSAVTVMPSRWYENQPMIVLESFACGVPVVGTRLGGTTELIEPDVDGDLVAANDPAALARALQPFLDNPTASFAMGRAGRRKIEDDFSPSAHLERIDHVYAEVIAEAADRACAPMA